MTTSPLRAFCDGTLVRRLFREVEAEQLVRDLEPSIASDLAPALNQLRVAAIVASTELWAERSLDDWLRSHEDRETPHQCFECWSGYLDAALEQGQSVPVDDLLSFSSIGLCEQRPNEVRDFLRRPRVRDWIDDRSRVHASGPDWISRVRETIALSILLLVRQEHHEDVRQAGTALSQLSELQGEVEKEWLSGRNSPSKDAAALLCFYHIAHASIRTSEFLLAGCVEQDGRTVADFEPELRRLLVRAEEFADLYGSEDLRQWTKIAGAALYTLRESSIWVQARGISERIDRLVEELTRAGRPSPLFSLLPSQQEALRSALLDPSRVALILQMPTSTGKTLLAEFAIAQAYDAYSTGTRIVYVVPTRALATQVRRTLSEDLGPLGIKVSAAGSAFEEDPYELHLLNESDGVVVSTPEKLDLLLRGHPEWFAGLRLVVVDEAHLLGDSERGARLELLLANIRREHPQARLLLLTPFMDNAHEVATWLSRTRSHSISIHWRPVRIVLGAAEIRGRGDERALTVRWTDPFLDGPQPPPLRLPTTVKAVDVQNNRQRIVFLARKLEPLGVRLALFSASPAEAEKAAQQMADQEVELQDQELTPQLRLAIAIAEDEYGSDSFLASCLRRGVAFHHSAISGILRYLIEDQVRASKVRFVAATSTLAQGMNFPVSTVLVHSVHKPNAGGNYSPSEFWNIAGRAGRVGMVERGLVIFADSAHSDHISRYSSTLSESLTSAILIALSRMSETAPLKEQYRDIKELRPFIQYLAHAAARDTPASALANFEELIQQSLVNRQAADGAQSRKLRSIARTYLAGLVGNSPLLSTGDKSGLGSFSFSELYAKLRSDPILMAGPEQLLSRRDEGFAHLVEALRWLPELDLAIGLGEGEMNVNAVARVIQGWVDGKRIHELSAGFPGDDHATRVRKAASYVFGKVSQTISWGAHAYLKGWAVASRRELEPGESMLPAFIQYGVNTAEATLASLLGVPRQFSTSFADQYRSSHGELRPSGAGQFKEFVESADVNRWSRVIEGSSLAGKVQPADARAVFRQMQGMPE